MSKHLATIIFVGSLFNLDNFYSVGWNSDWLRFQGDFNKEIIRSILALKPEVSRTKGFLTLSFPNAEFTFTV